MAESTRVAIVGAGTMGHGFAAHFALQDRVVTLVDHRQSNLDRARERIREAVAFLGDEELANASPDAVVDSIGFTLDVQAGVADAGVVIETVSEDLDVKHAVFRDVASAAPEDAILASNTSGIPITAIAEGVPEHAERVVGCHWWNPPYLMPLVEVVRGERTADETVDRTTAFVEAVDREPIVVERDVPGFVWNRIQFAVLREAMHIVEEGIASIEAVDTAVRDGYALRTATVGPFETVDLSGLDLFGSIAADLYPELCDDDEPGDLFEEYREAGRNGVETGVGFYEYDEPPEAVTRQRDERIAAIRRALASRES